jgi:phosphatidylglycerophosphatase C
MKLAIFDLDGTITRHDTLIQFILGHLKSRPWRLFGFVMTIPLALLCLLRIVDRGALKGSMIRWTIGGSTRAEIDAYAAQFVPRVLERGVFKAAMDQIAAHKRNGDVLVLMSASPDFYVPLVAKHLGFAAVTCTGVRWDDDRLEGHLTTANCRGAEKARRFGELRARYPSLVTVAYGNAASDLDHLRLADRGVLVNGNERARRRAVGLGVVCESWL